MWSWLTRLNSTTKRIQISYKTELTVSRDPFSSSMYCFSLWVVDTHSCKKLGTHRDIISRSSLTWMMDLMWACLLSVLTCCDCGSIWWSSAASRRPSLSWSRWLWWDTAKTDRWRVILHCGHGCTTCKTNTVLCDRLEWKKGWKKCNIPTSPKMSKKK